jgi:hypothetical protein
VEAPLGFGDERSLVRQKIDLSKIASPRLDGKDRLLHPRPDFDAFHRNRNELKGLFFNLLWCLHTLPCEISMNGEGRLSPGG